ncbi:alpha/beta fold hydrolase [Streptomyces sp. NPDC101234]|uniref:alpha/beta fold hydrolase n=1 Tax=Streptomyces sp. NPDC101234 TaxID=3366138 RepID=UPI0038068C7E
MPAGGVSPGEAAAGRRCRDRALLFWGERDPACQIEFGDELGAALRATRVLHLDCNHWTVLERPAEVAAALEAHWAQGTGR